MSLLFKESTAAVSLLFKESTAIVSLLFKESTAIVSLLFKESTAIVSLLFKESTTVFEDVKLKEGGKMYTAYLWGGIKVFCRRSSILLGWRRRGRVL